MCPNDNHLPCMQALMTGRAEAFPCSGHHCCLPNSRAHLMLQPPPPPPTHRENIITRKLQMHSSNYSLPLHLLNPPGKICPVVKKLPTNSSPFQAANSAPGEDGQGQMHMSQLQRPELAAHVLLLRLREDHQVASAP